MTARTRKAIGSAGIVLFVILYAAAVVTLGGYVPKAWWAQLILYAVAGTAWGLPIIPLIKWMNSGR